MAVDLALGLCSFLLSAFSHWRLYRRTLSSSSLTGDKVVNSRNEDLGKVEDIMLDVENGRVAYAVLSFGGFLGVGSKLFAIPWTALRLDQETKCFILDVPKETLDTAPGFDKDSWPDLSSEEYARSIHTHYNQPYRP
jgi:sporulation protein YlmC with PRC-barrel domain